MGAKYDFSGYATRNDIRCSDGRTIRKDAFIDNDGATVPLVWQHMHDEPGNVLGHALLENREDGVYTYGFFNDTEAGKNAKELVDHGDVKSLSIYANKLKQSGGDVPSLTEFLSTMICGGCRHNCSLVSPRCMKGRSKAESATVEYYETYGA